MGRLRTPDQGFHQILTIRQQSANSSRSAQIKTTPEGAAIDYLLFGYTVFFRPANPIKLIKPLASNSNDGGIGTA